MALYFFLIFAFVAIPHSHPASAAVRLWNSPKKDLLPLTLQLICLLFTYTGRPFFRVVPKDSPCNYSTFLCQWRPLFPNGASPLQLMTTVTLFAPFYLFSFFPREQNLSTVDIALCRTFACPCFSRLFPSFLPSSSVRKQSQSFLSIYLRCLFTNSGSWFTFFYQHQP